jgi:hypothetical protein
MSQPAVVLGSERRALRQTDDSRRLWFVLLGEDEAWVAVPRVDIGGGGGWFRTDSSLDPGSTGWVSVSGGEVLAYLEDGRDRAAELTATMVGNCMVDGLGLEALELADSLLDHGFALQVSVVPSRRAKGATQRN